jgi:hypothetical protein
MIVGLTGIARSGKDSVANALEALRPKDNLLRIQIAGPLKAYLRDLYDWTVEHTDGDLKDEPDERYPRDCHNCVVGPYGKNPRPGYRDVSTDIMGYSEPNWQPCPVCKGEAVIYLTPRHAMQQLGGEFAESTFPAIYAVRAARAASVHHGLAVVTDCRFLRDIEAIKAMGGVIIEVHREAARKQLSAEALGHKSETARRSPEFQALVDHHVHNDGTLADLSVRVAEIVGGVPTDPTIIIPGCWVTSRRFGEAICIEDRGDHYRLRYRAERLMPMGKVIWVANGDGKANVTFLRPPDQVSRDVLALTGPYGEGSEQ